MQLLKDFKNVFNSLVGGALGAILWPTISGIKLVLSVGFLTLLFPAFLVAELRGRYLDLDFEHFWNERHSPKLTWLMSSLSLITFGTISRILLFGGIVGIAAIVVSVAGLLCGMFFGLAKGIGPVLQQHTNPLPILMAFFGLHQPPLVSWSFRVFFKDIWTQAKKIFHIVGPHQQQLAERRRPCHFHQADKDTLIARIDRLKPENVNYLSEPEIEVLSAQLISIEEENHPIKQCYERYKNLIESRTCSISLNNLAELKNDVITLCMTQPSGVKTYTVYSCSYFRGYIQTALLWQTPERVRLELRRMVETGIEGSAELSAFSGKNVRRETITFFKDIPPDIKKELVLLLAEIRAFLMQAKSTHAQLQQMGIADGRFNESMLQGEEKVAVNSQHSSADLAPDVSNHQSPAMMDGLVSRRLVVK